jgi:hypothetical protein
MHAAAAGGADFANPSIVRPRLLLAAGLRGEVRSEWDEVKQHDVLFLLTIRPPDAGQLAEMRSRADEPGVMELYGLVTVRGCEVIEVKDEGGDFMIIHRPLLACYSSSCTAKVAQPVAEASWQDWKCKRQTLPLLAVCCMLPLLWGCSGNGHAATSVILTSQCTTKLAGLQLCSAAPPFSCMTNCIPGEMGLGVLLHMYSTMYIEHSIA